jgi:hypothetical protein
MFITILIYVVAVVIFFLALFFLIIIINILQNGIGGWNGKSLDENLGMPAEKATFDDIKDFSKAQLMQLFYSANAPSKDELKGEIDGMAPPVGVFYPFALFFLTYIYGQGSKWIGKAFKPTADIKSPGYNLFLPKNSSAIERKRKMDTYIAASNIDRKDSYCLDYSAYNKCLVKLLLDEVRKINHELYIGMGYLTLPLGSLNPIPFILHGKFRPWVGPDKK